MNAKILGALTLALFTLTACGGGGSSNNGQEPEPEPSPGSNPANGNISENYFVTQPGLHLVSEKSLDQWQELSSGTIRHVKPLFIGKYQGQVNRIKDITLGHVIYEKAGLWWRVDLKEGYKAVPKIVSNEQRADHVCAANLYTDYQNSLNSRLVYETAGMDNLCSTRANNLHKMISLGMNADASPLNASANILGTATDPTTGAIHGWYVAATKKLSVNDSAVDVLAEFYFVDVNFNAQKTLYTFDTSNVFAALTSNVIPYGTDSTGNLITQINNTIYRVNQDKIKALYTSDDIIEQADLSDQELYVIEAGSTRNLKQIDLDGGAARLVKNIADINALRIFNGSKHIVLETRDDIESSATTTLIGVHKQSGAQLTLASQMDSILSFTPKYIYFTSAAQPGVVTVSTDGVEKIIRQNAEWTGLSYPNEIPARGTILPNRVIMTEKQGAVVKLWSYNATNQSVVATLGNLPSGASEPTFFGIGSKMVGTMKLAGKRDVFFIDTESQGSLKNITNTPEVDESLPGTD
jgi:hypothetical protein